MYRESKTADELKAIVLAEIHQLGFPSVSDVQIFRVVDLRADFNWSLGPVALGEEDSAQATSALGRLVRHLQDQYDLAD